MKPTIYLTNAFSIQMLSGSIDLKFSRAGQGDLLTGPACLLNSFWCSGQAELVNAIGHPDMDRLVANILAKDGLDIPVGKRVNTAPDFNEGDVILVAQYVGGRLPEGAIELPKGAKIEFWLVRKK